MSSQLLEVAARLTREKGRVPSLAELATTSGASRATVYRAFANQGGLVAQLRARGEVVPDDDGEVFDAVRGLILAQGLDGTSLGAVARRSGLSVATLHRRYDGRDGLLFAFFDQLAPRSLAWRLPDDGAAEEVLAGFAVELSAWIAAEAPLLVAALSCSPPTRARLRSLRAAGVGTQEALADWLRRRAEAAGRELPDPLRAARVFLGAVLGLGATGPASADDARWWARSFLRGLGLG